MKWNWKIPESDDILAELIKYEGEGKYLMFMIYQEIWKEKCMPKSRNEAVIILIYIYIYICI